MSISRQADDEPQIANQPSETSSTLAKALAPEDVRAGDFVTLLHEIAEVPSFFWCCDNWQLAPDEPVRIRLTSAMCGVPMKVRSVCLPFVLVKHPTGEERSVDLRKCRLARLARRHATKAWKAYKKRRNSQTSISK